MYMYICIMCIYVYMYICIHVLYVCHWCVCVNAFHVIAITIRRRNRRRSRSTCGIAIIKLDVETQESYSSLPARCRSRVPPAVATKKLPQRVKYPKFKVSGPTHRLGYGFQNKKPYKHWAPGPSGFLLRPSREAAQGPLEASWTVGSLARCL